MEGPQPTGSCHGNRAPGAHGRHSVLSNLGRCPSSSDAQSRVAPGQCAPQLAAAIGLRAEFGTAGDVDAIGCSVPELGETVQSSAADLNPRGGFQPDLNPARAWNPDWKALASSTSHRSGHLHYGDLPQASPRPRNHGEGACLQGQHCGPPGCPAVRGPCLPITFTRQLLNSQACSLIRLPNERATRCHQREKALRNCENLETIDIGLPGPFHCELPLKDLLGVSLWIGRLSIARNRPGPGFTPVGDPRCARGAQFASTPSSRGRD
eukprot:scaffold434_cov186-Pinguiococcus_pyrenoidosus.AAC.12